MATFKVFKEAEMLGIGEILRDMVDSLKTEITGVRGVVLSTYEGLPIVSSTGMEEMEGRISAMISALSILADKVGGELTSGNMEEVAVSFDDSRMFCYRVDDSAIMAVITDKDINMGMLSLMVPRFIEKVREVFYQ